MPLRIYADECVDGRIVNGLRRRGIDIVTVADEGCLGAPDAAHLQRASTLERVIMTADQDFLRLAHETVTRGAHHPGVVYILPATPIGEAIRSITKLCLVMTPEAMIDWIEWIP